MQKNSTQSSHSSDKLVLRFFKPKNETLRRRKPVEFVKNFKYTILYALVICIYCKNFYILLNIFLKTFYLLYRNCYK